MPFKNFSMWRGRLPHWRADDVCYFVTFRHRRELSVDERRMLLRRLLRQEGASWHLDIVCVLPESTSLMGRVREGKDGRPIELSEPLETAKRKAGVEIIKKSGERFPPFYTESFDRIVRDDIEYEERWMEIAESPSNLEGNPDPEDYETLWIGSQPQNADPRP